MAARPQLELLSELASPAPCQPQQKQTMPMRCKLAASSTASLLLDHQLSRHHSSGYVHQPQSIEVYRFPYTCPSTCPPARSSAWPPGRLVALQQRIRRSCGTSRQLTPRIYTLPLDFCPTSTSCEWFANQRALLHMLHHLPTRLPTLQRPWTEPGNTSHRADMAHLFGLTCQDFHRVGIPQETELFANSQCGDQ